jgi:hypothetical protein
MEFIPTYLCIKQHAITGKLYLCKTTKKDPIKYKGSGKHWKSHIKKHGKEHVVTLWYQLYDNVFDLVADSLGMSIAFNIIKSDSWLNLIFESGLHGGNRGRNSNEINSKIRNSLLGHKLSEETKLKISKTLTGQPSKNKGKHLSIDTKNKLSLALKGKIHPRIICEICGDNISEFMKTRHFNTFHL